MVYIRSICVRIICFTRNCNPTSGDAQISCNRRRRWTRRACTPWNSRKAQSPLQPHPRSATRPRYDSPPQFRTKIQAPCLQRTRFPFSRSILYHPYRHINHPHLVLLAPHRPRLPIIQRISAHLSQVQRRQFRRDEPIYYLEKLCHNKHVRNLRANSRWIYVPVTVVLGPARYNDYRRFGDYDFLLLLYAGSHAEWERGVYLCDFVLS